MRNLREMPPLRRLMLLGAMANAAGKLIEDTATGNPLKFLTDVSKPLKSLVANFLPIQASGTPSPDNILPITGWTGCNVYMTGKNLLHVNEQSLIFKSIARIEITYTETGCVIDVPQSQYSSFVLFEIMPITADMVGIQFIYSSTNVFNEDRIISCDIEGGNRTTIPNGIVRQIDVGKILALRIYPTGEGTYTISEMQMEIGTSSTAYSPYTGETIPVSFPSTIYGGFVDLITGEVWETYGHKYSDGSVGQDWSVGVSSGLLRAVMGYDRLPDGKPKGNSTENLKVNSMKSTTVVAENNAFIGGTGNFLCFAPLETTATKQDWLDYLSEHPIDFVYELAEPALVTTLTPQQINAIKGNNTVWSDANGSMTAVYLKKA